MNVLAARVAGTAVSIDDVDAAEAELRARMPAASLPLAGTSEGRQLRRWVTQLLVTRRVVAVEATRLGVSAEHAPGITELLPDATARLEIGSVLADVLAEPLARALFDYVTADVTVPDAQIAAYHSRNPTRFAGTVAVGAGWQAPVSAPPPLGQVRDQIHRHLHGAARRRAFRCWLDTRCADLVELAPGYEHPGDPRQPDNIHRH